MFTQEMTAHEFASRPIYLALSIFVFFFSPVFLSSGRVEWGSTFRGLCCRGFLGSFLKWPGPLEWCKLKWSETGLLLLLIVLFLFNYRSLFNRFHRCCKCLCLLFDSSTAFRQLPSPSSTKKSYVLNSTVEFWHKTPKLTTWKVCRELANVMNILDGKDKSLPT